MPPHRRSRPVGHPRLTPGGSGHLFCCVVGEHADGHDFAAEAVAAGQSPSWCSATPTPTVRCARFRDRRRRRARRHGDSRRRGLPTPAERLRTVVGVTGTNGKTTVVSAVAHVLSAAGRRVEAIGTLTGARTTPEAPTCRPGWPELVSAGVTDVAMEVSSHACRLHRVDGVVFDVACSITSARTTSTSRDAEGLLVAKAQLFGPGWRGHRRRRRRPRATADAIQLPPGHPMVAVSVAGAKASPRR